MNPSRVNSSHSAHWPFLPRILDAILNFHITHPLTLSALSSTIDFLIFTLSQILLPLSVSTGIKSILFGSDDDLECGYSMLHLLLPGILSTSVITNPNLLSSSYRHRGFPRPWSISISNCSFVRLNAAPISVCSISLPPLFRSW